MRGRLGHKRILAGDVQRQLLSFLVFLSVVSAVFGAVHYYLWHRLVKAPAFGPPWSAIGGWAAVCLALLMPAGHLVSRMLPRSMATAVAFVTQGDANATRDPFPVPARNVRGHVLWHVSSLGTVMDLLQWPRSFILLVAAPATLLAVGEARSRLRRSRNQGPTSALGPPTVLHLLDDPD